MFIICQEEYCEFFETGPITDEKTNSKQINNLPFKNPNTG